MDLFVYRKIGGKQNEITKSRRHNGIVWNE